MARLLTLPTIRLIIEWHPTLQQAAGHAPDALPRRLMNLGFSVQVVTHTQSSTLKESNLLTLTAQLLNRRSPVELLAHRKAS
jgi:hypothetical protein